MGSFCVPGIRFKLLHVEDLLADLFAYAARRTTISNGLVRRVVVRDRTPTTSGQGLAALAGRVINNRATVMVPGADRRFRARPRGR